MVWQLPEISENKAGHILYYFDTVDQIPLCHCNYVYHNMVIILVSADIYTDEIMKNMSNQTTFKAYKTHIKATGMS